MPVTITRLEELIQQRNYPPTEGEVRTIAQELLLNLGILELRNVQLRKAKSQVALTEDVYRFTMKRAQKMQRNAKILLAISIGIALWAGGFYVF
jgi:hypothetical protein